MDLSVEQAEAEFPVPNFYLSLNAVQTAIRDCLQFNIIHVASGLKLAIIQRKETEFGLLDIVRGHRLLSEGFYDAWFASRENVMLMKLRYFRDGGLEKHLRDIASILLIQDALIDRQYITEWATKLGFSNEWELVCQRRNNARKSGLSSAFGS